MESICLDLRNALVCPITLGLLHEPVLTKTGFTFSREALVAWLSRNGTCPMTGVSMTVADIYPNTTLQPLLTLYRRLRNTPRPPVLSAHELPVQSGTATRTLMDNHLAGLTQTAPPPAAAASQDLRPPFENIRAALDRAALKAALDRCNLATNTATTPPPPPAPPAGPASAAQTVEAEEDDVVSRMMTCITACAPSLAPYIAGFTPAIREHVLREEPSMVNILEMGTTLFQQLMCPTPSTAGETKSAAKASTTSAPTGTASAPAASVVGSQASTETRQQLAASLQAANEAMAGEMAKSEASGVAGRLESGVAMQAILRQVIQLLHPEKPPRLSSPVRPAYPPREEKAEAKKTGFWEHGYNGEF